MARHFKTHLGDLFATRAQSQKGRGKEAKKKSTIFQLLLFDAKIRLPLLHCHKMEAHYDSLRSSDLDKVNALLTTHSGFQIGEKRPNDKKPGKMLDRMSSKRPHVCPKTERTTPLLISSASLSSSLKPSERNSAVWWWPCRSLLCGKKATRHRTYRLPKRWPLSCSTFLSKLALLLNCHIFAQDSTASTLTNKTSASARQRPPAPPRPTFSSIFRSISTLTLCLTTLTRFSRVLFLCLIMFHTTTTVVFSIDDSEVEKGSIK